MIDHPRPSSKPDQRGQTPKKESTVQAGEGGLASSQHLQGTPDRSNGNEASGSAQLHDTRREGLSRDRYDHTNGKGLLVGFGTNAFTASEHWWVSDR
ncbi:hypothetical protein EYF80_017507 [Liparis tanakae]|uniref:Uncharacterized protein n=1 Tax=Liparis tanakae TaxID=230148 RepID=A0A4Z2I4R0_9TELE|nr:hypothetical protein EYF80_017507 [Liparis tanakae]